MNFEYDENKSNINKQKHNIDFIEVQKLWLDDDMIEFKSKIKSTETRYLVIGQINMKYYTVIITYRALNIRIISARKSRKKEIVLYDSIRTG